ncbi:MAG: tRNA 5-methoxyuridine(34)/uridine 5-oxyacetic acid(34) synthase CmoB [Glaciecola sp.]
MIQADATNLTSLNWRSAFYQAIIGTALESSISTFMPLLDSWEVNLPTKDRNRWRKQLEKLPDINDAQLKVSDMVSIASNTPLSSGDKAKTIAILKQFMPWRKGPFSFFDIEIDTEWRSDWKWQRVLPHIGNLQGQHVLDVGCGSGYHLFRMHEQGAKQVIGIDPTALFFFQFHCFKRYFPNLNLHFLPLGIEQMPATRHFDTVFSMGVLYHRHDPIKFLQELKQQLRPNGQLVLETLVVDGDVNTVLMPESRYAQMRNVWFLPSIDALTLWLKRVGFSQVDCVDVDVTSINEQRATEWMENHSLADFLDPLDPTKTIEGYPAPKRAVLIAKR